MPRQRAGVEGNTGGYRKVTARPWRPNVKVEVVTGSRMYGKTKVDPRTPDVPEARKINSYRGANKPYRTNSEKVTKPKPAIGSKPKPKPKPKPKQKPITKLPNTR